jgi:hypothetical protein
MSTCQYPFYRHFSLFICVLVSLIAACADLSDPGVSRQQEFLFKGAPYYTYEGNPIYLNIDPSRVTLSISSGVAAGRIRASLSAAGLDGAEMKASPVQSETLDVILPGKPSVEDAVAAVTRLRRDSTFAFVANTYRTQEAGEAVVLHNRLVVHLQDGAGAGAIERLDRELGAWPIRGQGNSDEYVLAYPLGVDPLAFALTVAEQPEVAWVDPDKTSERKLSAIPTDPYFADQYYARNAVSRNGVPIDTNIQWAWDLTHGAWSAAAGPFVVAVIDDGVQSTHPDLDSSSIFGYDTFNNSWGFLGCTDCAINPDGNYSHGTLVAGIIKSQQNNGMGLAGLAPDVKLLPIQIFKGTVPASDLQIATGIDAAWQNDAQVLSNSWGGGAPSNAITAAINRATTQGRGGKGSVVVFSAGNTSARQFGIIGHVTYPATLPNVIAVGAINRNGGLTDYTPEGSELDIVTPSGHFTGQCIGDVVTTDLIGTRGCNDGPQGNIDYSSTFSGTSAAAPQVSSVAAMVISRAPTMTEAQVRSAITSNADSWGSATQFGAGKLNAYRALVGRTRVSISGPRLPPTSGIYTYSANASGGVGGYTYQWSLSINDGSFFSVGSNSSSVSLSVDDNETLDLAVTVTNGPDGQRATSTTTIFGPTPCLTTPSDGMAASNFIPAC